MYEAFIILLFGLNCSAAFALINFLLKFYFILYYCFGAFIADMIVPINKTEKIISVIHYCVCVCLSVTS